MFSDPMTALMTILMLFFVGTIFMFLCVMRTLSIQRTDTREASRKQQALLSDLERQFMEMSFALRVLQESVDAMRTGAAPKKQPPAVDMTQLRQGEDLMGMLETTRKKSAELGFADPLASPAAAPAHPLADIYSPGATSFEDPLLGARRSERSRRGA